MPPVNKSLSSQTQQSRILNIIQCNINNINNNNNYNNNHDNYNYNNNDSKFDLKDRNNDKCAFIMYRSYSVRHNKVHNP